PIRQASELLSLPHRVQHHVLKFPSPSLSLKNLDARSVKESLHHSTARDRARPSLPPGRARERDSCRFRARHRSLLLLLRIVRAPLTESASQPEAFLQLVVQRAFPLRDRESCE